MIKILKICMVIAVHVLLASAAQAVEFMHGPGPSGITYLYADDSANPSSPEEWHQDWYALVGSGSQWRLSPTTLKISKPNKDWPFQAVSSVGGALYFIRGEGLNPGHIKGAEFSWKKLRTGGLIDLDVQTAQMPDRLSCYVESDNVTLNIKLGKHEYAIDCDAKSNKKEAYVYLTEGTKRQLLVTVDFSSSWLMQWIGDLDMDGRLDFIDSYENDARACQRIWLSSGLNNEILIRKAGETRSGCEPMPSSDNVKK